MKDDLKKNEDNYKANNYLQKNDIENIKYEVRISQKDF